MNTETFKRAGILLNFCPDAVVPEIPYTEDVLYALQLSEVQKHYDFCTSNYTTYMVNVELVCAAVCQDVLNMDHYSVSRARKMIAEAIIDLCPQEAKCLFNNAFVEAQEIFVGQPAPSRTANAETLRQTCGCHACKKSATREYA